MKINDYVEDVAAINGLVAVCYLVKAGASVTVVEASAWDGGMISTDTIFPEALHHLINKGGIQPWLFRSTTIEHDFGIDVSASS